MALWLGVVAMLGACKVRLLDDYSKDAEQGLITAFAKVDGLFDGLAEATEPGARAYGQFAGQYAEVHELIRIQVLREAARPLNKESYGIVATIDTLFSRYRREHRAANDVPELLIDRHRDNLRRLFVAALRAERVKQDQP